MSRGLVPEEVPTEPFLSTLNMCGRLDSILGK